MPKYRANNQIYNIPVEEEQRFLQAFPTAELIEEEEVKQQPTVETTAPAVGSRRITQPNVGVSQQAVGSLVSQQPEQEEEEEYEPNILQSLAARTARGVVGAVKGLSSVKDAMIFSAYNLFDPDMTPEEKTALYERIESSTTPFTGIGSIVSTDDLESAEDWLTKYVRDDELENKSVIEALGKGDFGEAAELTVGGALESIPSVLAALSGYGGIALFGASVAGNKFDEELEKNPQATTLNLATNAVVSGATEAGFELVTRGILKKAGFINKEMGAKAASEFLKQSGSTIAKKVGLGYLGEAGSELATELTQTLNDAYGFLGTGKYGGAIEGRADERGIIQTVSNNMNNIIDAGIIGGFMGGTITSVGSLGDKTAVRNRAEEILTPIVDKGNQKAYEKEISKLTNDLKNTTSETKKEVVQKKIKDLEFKLFNNKKKVSLGLNTLEGDNLKKYAENAAKIEKLEKDLKENSPNNDLVQLEIQELDNQNSKILEESINNRYEKTTKTSEKLAKGLGIGFKRFKTTKSTEKYLKDKKKKDAKELAKTSDGFILQNPDGTQEIVINDETANKNNSVNVASHELLHGVLYNTTKQNPDIAINLGNALDTELNKLDRRTGEVTNSAYEQRLKLYQSDPESMQAEEKLTLFADAIATGDIKYNENIFTKIGDLVRKILESAGVKKKFNTGRDVYNFIRDYNADISEGGIRQSIIQGAKAGFEGDLILKPKDTSEAEPKVAKSKGTQKIFDELQQIEEFESNFNITPESRARREALQQQLKDATESTVKSSKSVLEGINNLIPKTVKTKQDFQNPRVFNRIYESLTQRDNVINNYIRSRAESQEEADRIIDNVTERLVKFDPEQTRADGTKVGIDGFGEFIFANTRFGKLDARKDLFKEGEKRKVEDKIDKPEAKQVKEKETADAKIDISKSVADIIPKFTKEARKRLAELGTIKAEKDLTGKKGTDKQLIKKRNKAFNDLFGKQAFDTIKDTFGKNTKTAKDFTNFLNKNYDVLAASALNYIDFQMGSGPSSDWSIENPPSKQEFIDYYEGKDIAPGKPASIKSDRKKSLINAVARNIADTERIEFAKQDPATAQAFKEKTSIPLASRSNYAKVFEKPATNLDREFRLYKGDVNKVLEKHIGEGAPTIESTKDVDNLITNIKDNLLPLFDYNFFFTGAKKTGTIFTKSGASGRELTFGRKVTKEERKKLNEYYTKEIQKLRKFKNFGKPIMLDGKPITKYTADYNTEIGENVTTIEKNIKSGKIQAFNRKWGTVHKEMWNRLDKYINSLEGNKKTNAAIAVAQYMKLSASNDNHPNRLGAQFVGYSTNPVGFTTDGGKFKLIEWEHAMPQTGAYMYLLDSILDTSRNFNLDYTAVVNNFKLLALDKADDVKLTGAGYQRTMPEGWKVFQNSWLERYLNPTVALFNNGIDPAKIKLLNNKTIAETYSVNKSGQLSEEKIKASKNLSDQFNDILEEVKGVDSKARYSDARAAKLGKKNNPFKFFVPYSAEDYMGLIYPTLGKGKTGDKNLEWYKENIINPYAEGVKNYESAKVEALKTWEELKSKIKNTPAKLNKEAVRDFTNEDAIRLYLWDKQKVLPEGVSKKDIKALKKHVEANPELLNFANQIQGLTIDGYPEPTGDWLAGTITTDLVNYTNTVSRKKFLEPWQENVDIVYSKENMNKLRALYGDNYVEALQDMLHRMRTGRNRPTGANKLTNQYMNWVNDSVGTIMFFNTRSALLQTISSVNYLNWADNNPIKAAQAFANQKQYWSDFAEIFNSDFLKSRRSGLKTDVNADEIARTAETSQNKMRAGLSYLLKKGFLPTQMADSFAISVGGAAFYRNRINKYKQDGLSETEAKEKAFIDFKEITEESQQSSRPDRVSMQQASPLGRIILAFANTPMQYTRLTKKAALDLINNRGDWKTNLSKLAYYGAVQNIIFTALQSAMFAMLFSDEDDDKEKEKYGRVANGIVDTLLRGSGVAGAAVATAKNMVVKAIDEYQSGRPNYEKVANEITTLSPPINSKLRKLQSAGRAFTYKQNLEKIREEGPLSIDNPAYMAAAQTLSAVANIPLDRALRKMENLRASVDSDTEMWQRISLMLGYNKWDLGIKDKEIQQERERKALQKYLLQSSKLRKPKYKLRSNRKSDPRKITTSDRRISRSNLQKNLPEGVLGRANNDGTIDIKPGLPKEKRKRVIAHEKQHIKDMKSGQLNYDADYVYWKNNKYKRTNGHVIYNGKKYEDGHPKLPWEAKANKAEQKVS